MRRLITIPISHFCEKARWSLERAGIPYTEVRHVQGIHQLAAKRAGGGVTVPVLVAPEGVFTESEQIVEYADRTLPEPLRLFPSDPGLRAEVESLSRWFDEGLGPDGRRLMYAHMLEQRKLMLKVNNQGVPWWEGLLITWLWPLAVGLVNRALGVRPGREVEDEANVHRVFDAVGERLADERPYLCGERFTAADLTFAALAAAVVIPPEYSVALPQPHVLPASIAVPVRTFRDHPAGRFALRLFREERRRVVAAPAAREPAAPISR